MAEFLPIPGYDGWYEVSRDGAVLSNRRKNPRRLSVKIDDDGYPRVALVKVPRERAQWRSNHLLVLETYVGPRPDGLVARHLDGNPLNCSLSNLAWGTQSENIRDKCQHGTCLCAKTHCVNGHEFNEENTYWRVDRPGQRACRACNRATVAKRRKFAHDR